MQSSPRIEELRQKFHENPRRYFAPLANEYRKAGDPEQAIAICRAHLAQQPGHMSGHVVYGQALYDARRSDEARVVFQQALALDPENIIVLRHLGDIARQKGDVPEARRWYSRALDVDAQDAEVAAYLAELAEPLLADATESKDKFAVESEVADTVDSEIAGTPSSELADVSEPEIAEPETALFDAGDGLVDIGIEAPDQEPDTMAWAEEAPADQHDSPYLEAQQSGDQGANAAVDAPPAAASDEIETRRTPTAESSPIVTRTLAELYLQQGYIEPALDIYRRLAEREPEDPALRARINELEGDEGVASAPAAESEGAAAQSEVPKESEETEVDATAEAPAEIAPPEPKRTGSAASKMGLMEEAAGAGEIPERVEDEVEGVTDESASVEQHFTETALSTDLWDTADSWGAGLFADEEERSEIFGLPAGADATRWGSGLAGGAGIGAETAPGETAGLAGAEVEEAGTTSQPDLGRQAQESAGSPATESPPAAEGATGAAIIAEPPDDSPYADTAATTEHPGDEDSERPWGEISTAGAADSTPQLTIREFFATLGSMRPPARKTDEGQESTPSPGSEEAESESSAVLSPAAESEYVYADDAFASLFGNVPVSPDDSRAAAALSGAVAHAAPFSTPMQSAGFPPREKAASPASAEVPQESEEDIRRFREWLDGLAES